MSPAFEAGYLVHVDPSRTARCGDFVVIRTNDGRGFLRSFVRRTGGSIVCEQFNPREATEFEPTEVSAVHPVVGWAMRE